MIVRFYINKLTSINSVVTIEENFILPNGRRDLIYPVGKFGLYEALAFHIIFSRVADFSKTFLPTGVKLLFWPLWHKLVSSPTTAVSMGRYKRCSHCSVTL